MMKDNYECTVLKSENGETKERSVWRQFSERWGDIGAVAEEKLSGDSLVKDGDMVGQRQKIRLHGGPWGKVSRDRGESELRGTSGELVHGVR